MKRWVVLLGLITVLAGFIRIYNIAGNPPAISWDEASIGYNAYSILKTGRDEHQKLLPLDTFAAFGDYKPPLPVYATVPFVAVFGLNELAVRLPSAVAGTLTVLVLYFLIQELFKKSPHARAIGMTASAVLAVTPWHIMLSRAGFEANIALLFLTTGVWWILAVRDNPKYLYICWLPFVAGVYTFNSARYAGPLLAAGTAIFVWKFLWRDKKRLAVGVVISLIALAPIVPHLLSKESRLRFDEVSIFTNLDVVLMANAREVYDGNTWWAHILDNRRLGYLHSYLVHFFDNVEPRFLFMKGDGNPKFSIQDTGQLLLVSAPFIFFGWLVLMADQPALGLLLLWWLIVSIIPAAAARETPHALRVENGLPVYIIVTAYALIVFINSIRSKRWKAPVGILLALLFAGNFIYFWNNLTVHYPTEYSGEWQYGYKQAIQYVDSVKQNYDTVVLTESIGRPYIYVLFYNRVDPTYFWKTKDASFDAAGFYNVYGFDKYRFVNNNVGEYKGKTLYILASGKVPKGVHIVKTIRVLNGTPVLTIFDSL